MRVRLGICLIIVFSLITSVATAEGILGDYSVQENFETAKFMYEMEEYAEAAQYFEKAGNFNDAKRWKYYCQAIDETLKVEPSAAIPFLTIAKFELLSAQNFEQASQWLIYCEGRNFESKRFANQALDCYQQIIIHDSIERFLKLAKREASLKNRDEVIQELVVQAGDISLFSSTDLFEFGTLYYNLEQYDLAADFFCAAGNFPEARIWRIYCEAISLIMNDNNINDAEALLSILSKLNFDKSNEWLSYCLARKYEDKMLWSPALDEYQKIFVFDSSERYISLIAKFNQ